MKNNLDIYTPILISLGSLLVITFIFIKRQKTIKTEERQLIVQL